MGQATGGGWVFQNRQIPAGGPVCSIGGDYGGLRPVGLGAAVDKCAAGLPLGGRLATLNELTSNATRYRLYAARGLRSGAGILALPGAWDRVLIYNNVANRARPIPLAEVGRTSSIPRGILRLSSGRQPINFLRRALAAISCACGGWA